MQHIMKQTTVKKGTLLTCQQRVRRSYTHHYLRFAAVPLAVVVRGDHLELKIRPPHVAVHDGRLHHAAVRLDNEAVFAVFAVFAGRRRDDEPVHHGTVVTGVLVEGLRNEGSKNLQRGAYVVINAIAIIMESHNHQSCAQRRNQIIAAITVIIMPLIRDDSHHRGHFFFFLSVSAV